MKALILAAGFGVRLREVVHGQPKHMVSINGRPFLRRLVELMEKRGIAEIILAVGYLPQSIKDEFKGYSFSEEMRPLGTGGAIKKAQNFFKEDFFVINGDTYLDIDYQAVMKFHRQRQSLVTRVDHGGVSCGVYVMNPRIMAKIPSEQKISLEKEIIPQIKNLSIYQTKADFIDIGSPEGYDKAIKQLR